MFLHGGVMHVLVNSVSLYWLGSQMERIYGPRKFLLVYVIAGIAGFMLSYALSSVPSLGASGAIFGLIGAGLIFPLRFRSLVAERARSFILTQLLLVAIINLSLGIRPHSGVDNWAHVGGLVGGGIAALFLKPDVLESGPRSRFRELALSVACVVVVALMGGAALAQWQWAVRSRALSGISPSADKFVARWRLNIPRGWSRVGSVWTGPAGAQIRVIDGSADPQLIDAIDRRMELPGVRVEATTINGIEVRRMTLISGRSAVDVNVYLAHRFRMVVTLGCPIPSYERLRPVFTAVAQSVRVDEERIRP